MIDWDQVQYFAEAEFACKCGCGQADMQEDFISLLDKAREEAGVSFVVTSGFRCAAYNAMIPGASTESSHTRGYAADIATQSSYRRLRILRSFLDLDVERLGVYHDGHIHVDTDPEKPQGVCWTGVS